MSVKPGQENMPYHPDRPPQCTALREVFHID